MGIIYLVFLHYSFLLFNMNLLPTIKVYNQDDKVNLAFLTVHYFENLLLVYIYLKLNYPMIIPMDTDFIGYLDD
jgi:hypothetical protein